MTPTSLQRLVDSLQVLVLVLPAAESGAADPRSMLISAAARQVLDDVETFRDHLVRARQERVKA